MTIKIFFAKIIVHVSRINRQAIQKYIPKPARTGRPRSNDRVTINGIMFVLVTGCRWREMPEKYGSKSTAHRRLQNWQQRKVWKKILSGAIKSASNHFLRQSFTLYSIR